MDNESEITTAKPSTNGYQRRLKRKMARLQLGYSALETHTFKRFYKTPLILSNLLFLVLFIDLILVSVKYAPDSVVGAFIVFALSMVAYFVSSYAKAKANTLMIRSRLWGFGKSKFATWPEFAKWIAATDAEEIEFLAGEPDDSWVPIAKGGGQCSEDWDKE